jgi:transcriptional regulator with XRE-family HTH domain
MTPKTIGNKIRQARLEFGLTQADLAYRIGVATQTLSAYESGRIRPAMQYLAKIAQFTHKPLYFFTGQRVLEALDRVEKVIEEMEAIKEILANVTEDD